MSKGGQVTKSKKNIGWHVRQGDVLVVRIDAVPAAVTEVPRDEHHGVVLAYGEVTGHAHAIAHNTKLYRDESDARFLRVGAGGAVLRHEEHSPINLPAGDYRVVRQVEYSPEEIRQVAD